MEANVRIKHFKESENHCLWYSVTNGVGAAAKGSHPFIQDGSFGVPKSSSTQCRKTGERCIEIIAHFSQED